MRILLIDDSVTMRRIQANQLKGIGITQIFEAGDGQEGLDQLKDNMPIDVVFLDWNMPLMDGITCLKKMRENTAYKDVKILMCTSESEKARVFEAIKAGANDYIVKPFGADALKKKLRV